MLDKNIDQINIEDIKSLVETSVVEKKTLEFKAALPGNSHIDKREFLADSSSFANTEGGYIVYGVADSLVGKEVDLKILGFESKDIDSEISRLENLLRTAISPRMNYNFGIIANGEKFIVIIRIDPSLEAPHRVTLEGHDKFYKRNSNGKYPMEVSELRVSFLKTSSLIDNIKGFVNQRIFDVRAGDTPLPIINRDCFLSIHIIPMSSFTTEHKLNNENILNLSNGKYNEFKPFSSSGYSHRINLEGVIVYATDRSNENIVRSYSQLYRDGRIESVESSVLGRIKGNQSDKRDIPMGWLEKEVMEYTVNSIKLLSELSFKPPFYVYLTLFGVKGLYVLIPDGLWYLDKDGHQIVVNDLRLPPVIIDNIDFNIYEKFRPIFDIIWNASGFDRSFNFDKDGNYIGR